jgi:hypothetical protein
MEEVAEQGPLAATKVYLGNRLSYTEIRRLTGKGRREARCLLELERVMNLSPVVDVV